MQSLLSESHVGRSRFEGGTIFIDYSIRLPVPAHYIPLQFIVSDAPAPLLLTEEVLERELGALGRRIEI